MSHTVIVRTSPTAPLTLASPGRLDVLLAKVFSARLDARLAAGADPESGRLLAVRAAQLVDPRHRRMLADSWDEVLDRARRPRGAFDPRVPVSRHVLGAAAEIGALTRTLRSTSPAAARDIARARALLTDGAGPVYSGAAGLRAAIARLL